MYFGAHVSITPSFDQTPKNAADLGCEVFQFFSQSPRIGKRKIPDLDLIKKFKENLKKYKQKACYIHAPYLVNLASKNNKIFYSAINMLKVDLKIADLTGSVGVITHIGSAKDYKDTEEKEVIQKVIKALEKILEDHSGQAKLILENSAGSGKIIGSKFDQIEDIIKQIKVKHREKLGFCFDTAHGFESGFDITSKTKVNALVKEIDQKIGLKRLKAIHFNDSKTDLSSNSDRHEHLGQGKIGLDGLKAFIQNKKLKDVDFIVETPTLEGMKKDINFMKMLRGADSNRQP